MPCFDLQLQLTNLAVKFGGKYVYTALMAGIGPDNRLQRFSYGLGLGIHIPLGTRFWLDMDVAGSGVHAVKDPWRGNNLLAQGRANKELAAGLGISMKTASAHRANIMRKLNLRHNADLIHFAIRYKLVEI